MEAEGEDELMRLAAEHAREDHGMEVTPELAQEVRKHIEHV
jgi:predicted small metal-binding protein